MKELQKEGVLEFAGDTLRLPLPHMKKTGIGLKSFTGTEEELATYLKKHDPNADIKI